MKAAVFKFTEQILLTQRLFLLDSKELRRLYCARHCVRCIRIVKMHIGFTEFPASISQSPPRNPYSGVISAYCSPIAKAQTLVFLMLPLRRTTWCHNDSCMYLFVFGNKKFLKEKDMVANLSTSSRTQPLRVQFFSLHRGVVTETPTFQIRGSRTSVLPN